MNHNARIYVAGHTGLVGSAIVDGLRARGCRRIVTRGHDELDLTSQQAVADFFAAEKPDVVVLAAAKVGGIHANNHYPAEFIYNNLMIEANVIHQAWRSGIDRLLFLGSSCIYPREASQPMAESQLLSGKLEPTNEPYAIAKIAGIKLCESYNRQYGTHYRSVMPTNLYGPRDNFNPQNSHVIPALMRRIHQAKIDGNQQVVVWGSGEARREFLYVEDMASACMHVMDLDDESYARQTRPMQSHINVGTGEDITIRRLAELIGATVGYRGELLFDAGRPDGPPRKLLDVSILNNLGWKAAIPLEEGLRRTYQWFLQHLEDYRQ